MGTGIGIDCKRCGHQLNYDDGFDDSTQLCSECYSIVNFEGNLNKGYPILEGYSTVELIKELDRRYFYDDEIRLLIQLYNDKMNYL